MSNYVWSPSQIGRWRECQRKWGYLYLDGIREQPPASAALGSATHATLEAWLKDGTPPDLTTDAGRIAQSGLHHLPAPRTPGLEIERKFGLRMYGTRWRGKVDVGIIGPDGVPIVIDHKTTGNLRYAKTAAGLRGDVQAMVYAAEAMLRHKAQAADLKWIYYLTKGPPRSQPVVLRVTREECVPVLRDAARDTLEASTHLNGCADDLPKAETTLTKEHRDSACNAYGGCPYRSLCWERKDKETGMANDLLAKLKAKAAGVNPPAPEATAAAPAAETAPTPEAVTAPKAKAKPAPKGGALTIMSTLLNQTATGLETQAQQLRTVAALAAELGAAGG